MYNPCSSTAPPTIRVYRQAPEKDSAGVRSKEHLGRQQEQQPHSQAEHGADGGAHGGDFIAGIASFSSADVLSQQNRGGSAHGFQDNNHHVHHLVAVADRGHGSRTEVRDHELVHVSHQQL